MENRVRDYNIIAMDFEENPIMKVACQVMPAKVESTYLRLYSDVQELIKVFTYMQGQDRSIDRTLPKVDKLDQMRNAEEDLLNQLQNIIGGNTTLPLETWKMLGELVNKGIENQRQQGKYRKYENDLSEATISASLLQNQIPFLIKLIYEDLTAINALDLDENNRLDGIEMKDRHVSAIKQLNLDTNNPETSNTVCELLRGYTSLEITCFRKLRELALKILAAYKERSISEETFREFKPIKLGLSDMGNTYYYSVQAASGNTDWYYNILASNTNIINGYHNYLLTGEIAPGLEESIDFSSRNSYLDGDFHNTMANIIEHQKAKQGTTI